MNFSIIIYIIGYVLKIEGLLLLAPTFVGVFYGEKQYLAFLIMSVVTFAVGILLSFKKPKIKFSMQKKPLFRYRLLGFL